MFVLKPIVQFFAFFTLLPLVSCRTTNTSTNNGGSDQKFGVIVSESTVTPGDFLIIESVNFKGLEKKAVTVNFDETPTAIIEFDSKSLMVLVVPMLNPGNHEFKLKIDGKIVHSTSISFRKPPSVQFDFTYGKTGITFLSEFPSTSKFVQYLGIHRRILSFDVEDLKNNLLITGSVLHPLNVVEGFDDNVSIHPTGKKTLETPIPFQLLLPNLPRPFLIKIYDTNDEVVTEETFKNRKILFEKTIY